MSRIRVGLSEAHGMAAELVKCPPVGIDYYFPKRTCYGSKILKSPIKGFMSHFDLTESDIIESIISPVITDKPWIYSLASFTEALAFSIFGVPTPKYIRLQIMKAFFKRDNFKRLIFWSEAGKKTLKNYGGLTDPDILEKLCVVYPAIREVDKSLIKFNKEKVSILFSGDFFRKGGANVLDAFEKAQKSYPNISLRVCSDEKNDFNTLDLKLKEEYLVRIKNNKAIEFGRTSREKMINEVLPNTDIYLIPTYAEAFGFAILEAMAFGIPVISTNYMAIPEIMSDGDCGFLIDIERFDTENMFKGYVVNNIPEDFKVYVTNSLYKKLCELIESVKLREQMGRTGVEIARTKFSFEKRNKIMKNVYERALA